MPDPGLPTTENARPQRPVLRLSSRAIGVACALVVGFGLTGCAAWYERSADVEGWRIQREKQSEVDQFRRRELIDPRQTAEEREPRPTSVAVPEVLTLEAAIGIATEHNRDYQVERETLFVNALGLGLARRDFLRPVFSGDLSYVGTDGKSRRYSDVTSLTLGGRQIFASGATLNVGSTAQISRTQVTGEPDQTASLDSSVSLQQPLLRGFGPEVTYEQLTQTERELLYDARAFDLFRQTFVISVIDDYYGLVVQKKQLQNTRDRIVQQNRAVEQAEALFDAGRGSKLDVFRAEQSLLGAQSSLLAAEQSYRFALDRFKIRLGISVDAEFEIADEVPEPDALEMDLEKALAAALHNRLDVATERDRLEDRERRVRIARNSLLPDLGVGVSYDLNSERDSSFTKLRYYDTDLVTVSASLELPLDRRRERNDYRVAMVDLAQARRELEQTEDNVIIEVRDAFRRLDRSRRQIEIGIKEIASFQQSVEKAQIDLEAGRITNRDLVEARDDLTEARNQQLERKADYEVNRLELLRVIGILFVDEEGQVEA